MRQLLRLFLEVSVLRRGPQVLPASGLLTALTLATHAFSGALLSATLLPAPTALAYALAETTLLGAVVYGLLGAVRLRARAPQTLSALAGTGTLVNLAALPVMVGVTPVGGGGDTPGALTALAVLVLFAWSFAITAHVLRHALAVPIAAGAVAALGYVALSYAVLGALFPVAGG